MRRAWALLGVLILSGCPSGTDTDGDGAPDDADCAPEDPAVHPGAPELCNGVDDDCDGVVPPDESDGDADGVRLCDDCDDADPAVHPGAAERCNGIDDDCDGSVEDDGSDEDQDGVSPCDGDCDDTDPAVHPGAMEVCNGVDDDCDGVVPPDEVDGDADGYLLCDDCDDNDPAAQPGAAEVCNGVDDDCDGVVPPDEVDGDADGYLLCDDCDDCDPTTNPGRPERCNGRDDDCDGALSPGEVDADGDGLRVCAGDCHDTDPALPSVGELCDGLDSDCMGGLPANEADGDLDGAMPCAGDCDDADPTAFLGAPELCDGVDNDCDGVVPADELDQDQDGVSGCAGDCDDTDAAVLPGAVEICNGVDDDCDTVLLAGEVDADNDGSLVCDGDCDDNDPTTLPGAIDFIDGVDNDCDGVIDNLVAPCVAPAPPTAPSGTASFVQTDTYGPVLQYSIWTPAITDVNSDGVLDILHRFAWGGLGIPQLAVFYGQGAGTFGGPTYIPTAAAYVAFPGVAADLTGNGVAEWLSEGAWGFPPEAATVLQTSTSLTTLGPPGASRVAVGDCDCDGLPEVVVARPNEVELFHNAGGGVLNSVALIPTNGFAVPRLIQLDGVAGTELVFDDGLGTLESRTCSIAGSALIAAQSVSLPGSADLTLEAGDWDGDGVDELLRVNPSASSLEVFAGASLTTLTTESGFPGAARFADLDADGDLDAIDLGDVYINDPSGWTLLLSVPPGPAGSPDFMHLDVADYDGDGDIDFVLTRPDQADLNPAFTVFEAWTNQLVP